MAHMLLGYGFYQVLLAALAFACIANAPICPTVSRKLRGFADVTIFF